MGKQESKRGGWRQSLPSSFIQKSEGFETGKMGRSTALLGQTSLADSGQESTSRNKKQQIHNRENTRKTNGESLKEKNGRRLTMTEGKGRNFKVSGQC